MTVQRTVNLASSLLQRVGSSHLAIVRRVGALNSQAAPGPNALVPGRITPVPARLGWRGMSTWATEFDILHKPADTRAMAIAEQVQRIKTRLVPEEAPERETPTKGTSTRSDLPESKLGRHNTQAIVPTYGRVLTIDPTYIDHVACAMRVQDNPDCSKQVLCAESFAPSHRSNKLVIIDRPPVKAAKDVSSSPFEHDHIPRRTRANNQDFSASSNVASLLQSASTVLKQAKRSEAELGAEYLLAAALFGSSAPRSTLTNVSPAVLRQALTGESFVRFISLLNQRLEGKPIQHILGEWDFGLHTLHMHPRVFIPRPETEKLVDMVVKDLKSTLPSSAENNTSSWINTTPSSTPSALQISLLVNRPPCILEVGPGTGAIGLSILAELPGLHYLALDVNPFACELTRVNAQRLGLESRTAVHHVAFEQFTLLEGQFDAIVSNPPYIPSREISELDIEVRGFDPHVALDGGVEGLDVIVQLLKRAALMLVPHGKLWLEVDESHPPKIESWLSSHPSCGLRYLKTHADCFDVPRFCELIRVD